MFRCARHITLAVATASRWLYEPETRSERSKAGSSSVQLESEAQSGSTAKAAYSLERSCPNISMAPVLTIVKMVAALSWKGKGPTPLERLGSFVDRAEPS